MFYQLFNLIFSWFALANYFIAFTVLVDSLEDKSFHLNGIEVVNAILSYCYLGLLIMCFILALGNRPQGSKLGYTMAFVGFAFITIYMTVCSFSLSSFLFFLSTFTLTDMMYNIPQGSSIPTSFQRHPRCIRLSPASSHRIRRVYESHLPQYRAVAVGDVRFVCHCFIDLCEPFYYYYYGGRVVSWRADVCALSSSNPGI